MRNAIIALARDGKWRAEDGIAKLHRLLCVSGRYDVPSPDTLARVVDELHQETGEPEYFRPKRSRRKRGTAKSRSDLQARRGPLADVSH